MAHWTKSELEKLQLIVSTVLEEREFDVEEELEKKLLEESVWIAISEELKRHGPYACANRWDILNDATPRYSKQHIRKSTHKRSGNDKAGDRTKFAEIPEPEHEGQGYYIGTTTVPALIFDNVQVLDGDDFALPLDLARIFVKLYSDMGADLQMRETSEWLGMDVSLFQSIKQRMGLTHKSPDLLDEELEQLTMSELFEKAKLSLAHKKLVYRIGRSLTARRQQRKELEELRARRELEDRLIEDVTEKVRAIPYKQPAYRQTPTKTANLETALVICDVHVGEKSDKEVLLNSNENGVEALERRKKILKKKIERNMVRLGPEVRQGHLLSLGDLFDGIFPIINPFQEVKQDLHGEDQFMYGLDYMTEIILHYAEFIRPLHIWNVSGNHEATRSTRWYADMLWIAMNWIRERLQKYDDIHFHIDKSRYKSIGIGNNEAITCHGTGLRGGVKAKEEDGKSILLMSNGNKRYRYVIHGHYHEFDVTPLPRGFQKIQCHALTGASQYPEELYKTYNRPAQDLLVFDRNDGLEQMISMYLDADDPIGGLTPVEV